MTFHHTQFSIFSFRPEVTMVAGFTSDTATRPLYLAEVWPDEHEAHTLAGPFCDPRKAKRQINRAMKGRPINQCSAME